MFEDSIPSYNPFEDYWLADESSVDFGKMEPFNIQVISKIIIIDR